MRRFGSGTLGTCKGVMRTRKLKLKGIKVLVLSRKKNEAVVIGDGELVVKVMVVEIRGDKVRLGIQAPLKTPVHRQEVYDAIKRQGGSLAPEGP